MSEWSSGVLRALQLAALARPFVKRFSAPPCSTIQSTERLPSHSPKISIRSE
jgi:hypothetical protein